MSLTRGSGPLAANPAGEANYRIDGPKHRLWFHDHPRHIRAEIAGQTVLETVRGRLLHESQMLPRLYVPFEDFDASLLERTDHTTHCPFKGDAVYWSVRSGDRVAENAIWGYPDPLPQVPWLADYACMYFEQADAWFEEDEPVLGNFRDPFHRVDTRASGRHAEILAAGETIAETNQPVLLFETGVPTRVYVPRDDVEGHALQRSDKTTFDPYKGEATYWSIRAGDTVLEDAAWAYEDPLPEGLGITGHVSFRHDDIEIRLAEPAPRVVTGA